MTVSEKHVHLVDARGNTLHSNLAASCLACYDRTQAIVADFECTAGEKRKRGRISTKSGTAYLCSSASDCVASNRVFKRELDFYASMLDDIAKIQAGVAQRETQKLRRLFHNLISLNGHALQDFYSMIPQDKLANFAGYRSQKELVKDELTRYPDDAARLFLSALKNAAAVKSELAVFQKLYEASPTIRLMPHPIHKVVLNVANYFFQSLSDRGIFLQIDKTDALIRLDYESFQVALYHLFDNATKYAEENSRIRISFNRVSGIFEIAIDMTSLFLEESGREKVFEEGFSGAGAHAIERAGQGIGMGLITDLVKLNSADFQVQWGDAIAAGKESKVPSFAKNRFMLRFPESLSSRPPRADLTHPKRS